MSAQNPPIFFIEGLGRSGTTLLGFLLGAHSECVALGEVQQLISRPDVLAKPDAVECSCGATAETCGFWSHVLPELDGSGDYSPILRHFSSVYPNSYLVDTSKASPPPEARSIFMIRDVRAWSYSTGRLSFRQFHRWYRKNKAAIVGKFVVSYEELVLRPDRSLKRICDALGLVYEPQMLNFRDGTHHAVAVNRMRNQPAKMAGMTYDYRWLQDNRWLLPAALMPHVMRFNREKVYGYVRNIFDQG